MKMVPSDLISQNPLVAYPPRYNLWPRIMKLIMDTIMTIRGLKAVTKTTLFCFVIIPCT